MNTQLLQQLGLVHPNHTASLTYNYTDSPTGDLDIERLLAGKKECWRLPTYQSAQLKKKKIIITDPSIAFDLDDIPSSSGVYQSRLVCKKLLWKRLLAEGFEIYAWTGEITPIKTIEELEQALNNVQPIHKKELIEKIAKSGMSRDECFISDYVKTHELLLKMQIISDNADSRPRLNLNELSCLSNKELEDFLNAIPEDTPVILHIGVGNRAYLEKHKDIFEKYLRRTRTLTETLTETDSTQAAKPYSPYYQILELFQQGINWDELAELIKDSPVEYLDLEDSSQRGKLDENLILPASVKIIRLAGIPVDWKILDKFLRQNSRLTNLSLYECAEGTVIPDGLKLPTTLKVVTFVRIKYHWKELIQLIPVDGQITHLIIEREKKLNPSSEKDNLILPKDFRLPKTLLSLQCVRVELTWNDIAQLIRSDSTITELIISLRDTGNIPSGYKFPSTLKSLEANINLDELCAVLPNDIKLERLSLVNVSNLEKRPTNFQLPSTLRSLKLESQSANINQIIGLIPDDSELMHLSLNCKDMPDSELAKNKSFRSLLSLELRFYPIRTDTINQFLQQCPNLLHISITFADISEEDKNTLQKKYPHIIFKFEIRHKFSPAKDKDAINAPESAGAELSRELTLDANTGMRDTEHTVQQYFHFKAPKYPDPRTYRLDIFKIKSEYNNNNHFSQYKLTPVDKIIKLIAEKINSNKLIASLYKEQYEEDPNVFLGEIAISAKLDTWIALPSLTTKDNISPDEISLHPPVNFDLAYNEEDNLYYIRLNEATTSQVKISYLVHTNRATMIAPRVLTTLMHKHLIGLQFNVYGELIKNDHYHAIMALAVNERIQLLVDFFIQFTPKDITNSDKLDAIELLNAIISSEAGTCRHRSIAFLALASNLSIPNVRATSSRCHIRPEVKINDEWQIAELGGKPSKVNVKKLNALKKKTEHIKQQSARDNSGQEPLIETPLSTTNPFRTWDTKSSTAQTMAKYVEEILQPNDDIEPTKLNTLCVLNSDQIEGLYTELAQHMKKNKKQCYYIHDLNEIREHSYVITNNDGSYHKNDSKLAIFLKQAKPGDVLMVNWSDFAVGHVGYNTIIDAERTLLGIPIPAGVKVVGVLDRSNEEMGEDFYSRYSEISDCPVNLSSESVLPELSSTVDDGAITINFYDDDWKALVEGKIQFSAGKFHFDEPELLKHLSHAPAKIIFKNAPWHLADFRLFMTDLMINKQIELNGKTYPISNGITFHRDDTPYILNLGQYAISPYSENSNLNDAFVLNLVMLPHLFKSYSFENKQIKPELGWLEKNKNKAITLLVTETLDKKQWYKILHTAHQHGVKLNIVKKNQVSLPNDMTTYAQPSIEITTTARQSNFKIDSIVSSDPDFFAATKEDAVTISVNENTRYSDLIETIQLSPSDSIAKEFDYATAMMANELLLGKHIILKGNPAPTLLRQLESLCLPEPYLWINGKKQFIRAGQLTIVNDTAVQMPFVTPHVENASTDEIWSALQKTFDLKNIEKLKKACERFYEMTKCEPFSYAQLTAMLKRLEKHPDRNPINAVLRLDANYTQLRTAAKTVWRKTTSKQAKPEDVFTKRFMKFTSELENSPYLFIAGQSGIGKSNFIQKGLKKKGFNVMSGLDKLREFMRSDADQKTILFIDEANLYGDKTFDLFHGLFNKPPGLLIDGKIVPLPKNHHVIFAGNFGSTKGRQTHSLFSQHGNIITFKEFPDDYLRSHILKPVYSKLYPNFSDDDIKIISDIFIKIYHRINTLYANKHPLTPRNLQMMAMRMKSALEKTPDIKNAACMVAYDEVSGAVTKAERNGLAEWIKINITDFDVTVEKKQLKNSIGLISEDYVLTKRRINPVRVLDDLLQIRAEKISHPTLADSGSSGVIFEGQPGMGKSALAIAYLKAHGYRKSSLNDNNTVNTQKNYYHITPTDPVLIEKILTKAFHEGAVVIIDEMNTLPLEHLLNQFMSGYDMKGNESKHPGFFVIATQNPISYGKRLSSSLSGPFLNRFVQVDFKSYQKSDLKNITTAITKNSERAAEDVDEYFQAVEYAVRHRKRPVPNPRNLVRIAKPRK